MNRQPLAALPENDVLQDRKFWSQQVQLYLGDWLADDTPVSEVCAFVDQVFGKKKLDPFRGDPKFVQDDDACKEFSKLRSAIGGLYAWRLNNTTSDAERLRMGKEADFAFRQAFALCPYSPEALFRYVNLLIQRGRIDEALRGDVKPPQATASGRIALAVEDIHEAYTELKRKGARVAGEPVDFSVCWAVEVLDPDGNTVILHQRADGTCGQNPEPENKVAATVIAMERAALDRWCHGDPSGFLEAVDGNSDDVTDDGRF